MEEWQRSRYLMHARLPSFARKVAGTVAFVREFLAEHPGEWAISMSGGKDCSAVLYLALEAGWRGPIFHIIQPEIPEENNRHVAMLAEEHGLPLRTLHLPGAWDLFERFGFFLDADNAEARALVKVNEHFWKDGLREYLQGQPWVGEMLGLRKQESRARAMHIAQRGRLYQAKERAPMWTALPVAYWSGADIWAYLLSRGVPYLPRYDAAGDPERTRSEPIWLWNGGQQWGMGQGPRLRQERPEEWAELVRRFPGLRAYG